MNKNILAIAIAAAVAAPSAFAASTVYGLAHISVDSVQNAKNGSSTTENGSVTNLASNSSRLGFKGSEDLGAGLKAIYQFETTVAFDGESSTGGFGGQRNTFAGLQGGFGTVMLGIHDTPFKLVGRKYDMFGDRIGDMRNLTASGGNSMAGSAAVVETFTNTDDDDVNVTVKAAGAATATTGFDLRPQNVIAYQSPKFGGVTALVAYAVDEKNSKSNAADLSATSASLSYAAGNLGADIAYEVHGKGHTPDASKSMSGVRLGASYNFGSVKVQGFYANQDSYVSADNVKARNIYGLGASMKVTAAGSIKAQIGMADKVSGQDKTGANMYVVGYDHNMSKNTTAYAAYAMVDNEANATFSANGGGGHGDAASVNKGKDASAFSVGIIHKF
jgi:predicted porin